MQSILAESVLGGVVVAGAVTDLQTGKIPNWLTMPAMAAGLVINSFAGIGLAKALYGLLAGLGVYFLFFAIGFRGAGDAKLMGAVGAFVGWPQVIVVMIVVALLGAVAALGLALRQGILAPLLSNTASLAADILRLRWREVQQRSDFRAPGSLRMCHGPVIAAGTLLVILFLPA
jgi:prepilin peptidase CpaA